jgi:hypothetical protein
MKLFWITYLIITLVSFALTWIFVDYAVVYQNGYPKIALMVLIGNLYPIPFIFLAPLLQKSQYQIRAAWLFFLFASVFWELAMTLIGK